MRSPIISALGLGLAARQVSYKEANVLGQTVRLLNLLSGPLVVLLFLGAVALARRCGQRRTKPYPGT
ncbi:MAG: hypothetical protein ACFCUQ_04905 [Kiloniellales bacterium]